jgi:hypothetical protein
MRWSLPAGQNIDLSGFFTHRKGEDPSWCPADKERRTAFEEKRQEKSRGEYLIH